MARFSGTRNQDRFDGLFNENNLFVFAPGALSGTDHVFGSTNAAVIDTLAFTSAARVQAGKFDDTRNIEVIRLDVAGIDLTVSQPLAGSSQRGFLTISGSDGADIVSGQPTDPARGPVTTPLVFNSNGGADRFTGGEGDDLVQIGDADSTGTVLDGRGGNDTIRYSGTGTFDSAIFDSVTGFETIEIASRFGAAGDVILRDNLFGPGQTTLTVSASVQSTIDASSLSADKNIEARLSQENDTYVAGAGDNIVDGRDGDDYFVSGPGKNNFIGGGGYDTAVIDFSNATNNIFLYERNFRFVTGNFVAILDDSVEKVIIFGGSGDDIISGGTSSTNSVVNEIHGGAGNDRLTGPSGTDTIFGDEGDDIINVGNGRNNFADGGTGNDTLISIGQGGDQIFGGEGDDRFYNYAGEDIFGRPNVARGYTFDGGAGDDRFYVLSFDASRFGREVINGGSGGSDVLILLGNQKVDLQQPVATGRVDEIEQIILDDYVGQTTSTLTLSDLTVADISSERPTRFTASPTDDALIIRGDSSDTVRLASSHAGGFWSQVALDVGLNGSAAGEFDFWAYESNGQTTAFLAVDSDITVQLLAPALVGAPLSAEAFETAVHGAGLGGGFDRLEALANLA